MAALSNYTENKILDWLLRAQVFTPPATVYVALMTSAANDTGGGVEVTISAATAYARVAVTSSLTAWKSTQNDSLASTTGVSGTTSNSAALTFPTPNTTAWGSVVQMVVYDAATAGNPLFYATLAAPKTINVGDPAPSFAIAALTLQLDD